MDLTILHEVGISQESKALFLSMILRCPLTSFSAKLQVSLKFVYLAVGSGLAAFLRKYISSVVASINFST